MLFRILGSETSPYVRAQRNLLIAALVLTSFSAMFVVVPAYLLQPFVDEGMKLGSETVTWKVPWVRPTGATWWSWEKTERVLLDGVSPGRLLVFLSVIAFASILARSFTVYLGGLCATSFANRAVRDLRVDLFRKFVSLPLSFHHRQRSGELLGRATADLVVMQNRLANVVMCLVEYPLTAFVFLVYLVAVNYRLTLIVLIMAPLTIWVMRLFGRKAKKYSAGVQEATAALTSIYQEALLCLRVIHGFFGEAGETRRFEGQAGEVYRRTMRWSRWETAVSPIMDVAGALMIPAILILGRLYFEHSLGELTSMIYAFSRAYDPIKKLTKVHNSLRTLDGAMERVFHIMRTAPEIEDRQNASALPRHRDSIAFEQVSFGYRPGERVLEGIDLQIRFGELVAFVGSTGAGKSTLLDLIPRFYDVTSGRIRIDGQDIRAVTLQSLRSQIGLVSQETLLFHDTIARNVCYGRPQSTPEEIFEAARAAHAHEFILAQPRGYETVVGDRGMLLSGGQKQRLAIARALLVDPAILLLDEAASALDAESERWIQATLESLHGSRSILVVAHRLSTVLKADRIYVLESGRIVESGTREALLAANGRFRRLYDLQFGGER
jgi:ATP-binding cassette, subfamily B, bacterial MsbA